jgi:hypothetical protein
MAGNAGRLLKLCLSLVSLVGLASCISNSDSQELWRVPSPDSRVDAVLVRIGGPAMVGFSYKLFIVPHGANPPRSGERLLAERVKNLTAVWREGKKLDLLYDEALIYHFTNYWHSKEMDDHKYIVELRLVPSGPSQLGELGIRR